MAAEKLESFRKTGISSVHVTRKLSLIYKRKVFGVGVVERKIFGAEVGSESEFKKFDFAVSTAERALTKLHFRIYCGGQLNFPPILKIRVCLQVLPSPLPSCSHPHPKDREKIQLAPAVCLLFSLWL